MKVARSAMAACGEQPHKRLVESGRKILKRRGRGGFAEDAEKSV